MVFRAEGKRGGGWGVSFIGCSGGVLVRFCGYFASGRSADGSLGFLILKLNVRLGL